MPIAVWNDRLKTGIPGFDDHHRHLVGMLNSAFDRFVAGNYEETLEKLLDELADYATYHFAAEETWMAKYNYPGLADHKQQHAYFVKRITEIQGDYSAGRTPVFLEVLIFLKNWLTNHIYTLDKDYGRFASEILSYSPFREPKGLEL